MFGWRRRRRGGDGGDGSAEAAGTSGDRHEPIDPADAEADGPFDATEAPEDELSRLDLGSVRIPVPDGAQLQVEVDPAGPVRAVHVVTEIGRLTVNAYAAPRSSGLWREISRELVEQLRSDGARVSRVRGEWDDELVASSPEVALRFVGVDGPRWLLRGVAAGPVDNAEELAELLHDVVRGTVVVRGPEPLPVRTPLPIELPEPIARHIQQAHQAQQAQQQG
ncbi:Protein of unknown function (DUF3710) [Streptoalloteichus tenebrarius]|uniref:DUF3710 domain-containing protein n=1 Tax=Streptoalloteichus tenebrarius (strain ATCC 17920 / DSM 40477 / JCM 4838 / CBS 697.72 / NBRC 16177 / NCIMB 11028 / NRRL B-12390 / A12253. 1 / ISP 5477) TaxID=1933 RepID=A0ABT1HMW9_STRSD|nr:DUF3710 domain-containing protein [Streptoalloteichus tenebrarius]MCP2256855.1 Protein of unknown function (DUF3710) [Streptoalloteichus tenebrarius]BFF00238.1 DUF3710 domain-containing protein [Streptoalloteichus tenebrarius]